MTLTAWTHAILYSLTFPLSCVSMNSLWHHYHRHSRNSLHQHFLNKYIQHILYKAISALLHSSLLRTNSPLQIRDLRMVRTQAAPYGYWHLMNLILRPLLWQGLQAPQEFSRLSPRPYTIHCPIQVHSWSPSWSAYTTNPPPDHPLVIGSCQLNSG